MAFPATPLDGQIYTTADGREYVYSLAADTWNYQGIQSTAPLVNTNAAVPPTATDDISAGYKPSSLWVDTAAQKAYVNVSNTAGAAIWKVLDAGIKVQATAPLTPLTGEMYLNTTDGFAYVWNGTAWVDVTAAGATIKDNFTAIAAPIAGNDSTQGYSVGSRWIDTVNNKVYTCLNATAGVAVWHQVDNQRTPQKTAGGVVNAYTATSLAGTEPVTVLEDGMEITFSGVTVGLTNTGPSTLSLDGLPAIPILGQNNTPVIAGQLNGRQGKILLHYNAGAWYISQANAIGKGQTWQNVTAARALGVTYTNTTGRSIIVRAAVRLTVAQAGVTVVSVYSAAGTISTSDLIWHLGVSVPFFATVSAIVPAGSTYMVARTAAGSILNTTLGNWKELR